MRIRAALQENIRVRWRAGGTIPQLARMFGFTEGEIEGVIYHRAEHEPVAPPKGRKLVPLTEGQIEETKSTVATKPSAYKRPDGKPKSPVMIAAGKKAHETRKRNLALKKGGETPKESSAIKVKLLKEKPEKAAKEIKTIPIPALPDECTQIIRNALDYITAGLKLIEEALKPKNS